MLFKKQISIMAWLLAFSSLAKAGVLIEPYLGYEATKHSMTFTTGNIEAPGAITGTGYGLRLGYKLPVMFWAALDAGMGTGKLKFDTTGTIADSDVSRNTLGLTAGIDLPILLRFWVGTGFSDQMQIKTSTTSDTFKGSHTKVGLGFTALPFLSINAEYIMRKYTDGSGDLVTAGGGYANYLTKLEGSTVLISVSAPFNF